VRIPVKELFPKRAVVTAGMPYGNKGLHFGHLAGVFVPADVYARFLRDRIGRDNVLFVSGTDCFGSPINEGHRKAVEAGSFTGGLRDYVQANHDSQAATLAAFDISLDIFEGSGIGDAGAEQQKTTDAFITRLFENGWLEKRSTPQFFDVQAQTFLNGRQVVGHCPVQGCKGEHGYADECDMGHQYPPAELIAPKSTLTDSVPELRPVENWYFKLPEFAGLVAAHMDALDADPASRPITAQAVREFLVPPVIYIQEKYADAYEAVRGELPAHERHAPQKGKQSFTLEFSDIDSRDAATERLATGGVRFRTGKALVPFRLTGNIEWGVKAPALDGSTPGLTVWCWPESLWAPISFTQTALKQRDAQAAPDAWRDWWASDDARVYQFIGQDNIYFYGVAQTALWAATQGEDPHAQGTGGQLRQTTLVPDYHALFLGKKASSSSETPPPSADELLEHYSAEQLRAHWTSLGLDERPTSFSPKPFDPKHADEDRYPDPVLKESALLSNILNRIVRSCFYTAQKHHGGTAPLGAPSARARAWAQETVERYEQLMYETRLHEVWSLMDAFLRDVNKWWTQASRAASSEDDVAAAVEPVLRDLFYLMRVSVVLMHPIAPRGCELVFEYLAIEDFGSRNGHAGFFDWDHILEPLDLWATEGEALSGGFTLKELPPRFDFFGGRGD
jgi:methionyl-tRNA synthetase